MTNERPAGEISKAYDPKQVEDRTYKNWMDKGYFTPSMEKGKKPFVIVLPPPNVTGELHLGHALMVMIEDMMIRRQRMLGEAALWVPGTDHAGIATQIVVERELQKEGTDRHKLGREQFEKRVWEHVRKTGVRIRQQIQRLGGSLDWTREQFTLNEMTSKAVRKTFVNLYNKGLIYRSERIINWCPRCMTALSDLETEHEEEQGSLWYMRYPYEDGSGYITVATTRPETFLGDTAVAVNPDDERYKNAIGKKVVLPIINRAIPIIADNAVESGFGTGAVKVTPHHDPTDFEIGQRHDLPLNNVMNPDATMNDNAGKFKGMVRYKARAEIVKEIDSLGLLDKIEKHMHSVGHCDRCRTVVEPTASLQWFVKMEPLAKPALEAVQNGEITIIPDNYTKIYINWLTNIRDWCISRQLWWGHRIPVWYCKNCGKLTVAEETPSKCQHCDSINIQQDQDVLDTWFSSGLWPHSTLGWADNAKDYQYFYPNAVMETGYDILFFWVARMIMLGIENTGKPPFKYVYLHGIIRDDKGEKMSKMKGNGIDPLEMIDKYGTDALRFALTSGSTAGMDLRVSAQRMESARNFANKLWNASRFVIGELAKTGEKQDIEHLPSLLHQDDQWIISRLNKLVKRSNELFEQFQFGELERDLYSFLWSEVCDWYLERAKIRIRNAPAEKYPLPHAVLAHVLEKSLRLMHPCMPFITEEIWQSLKPYLKDSQAMGESIMIAPYPTFDASRDSIYEDAETKVTLANDIVQDIRNAHAELKVAPNVRANTTISGRISLIADQVETLKSLANSEIKLEPNYQPTKEDRSYVHDAIQVHVLLQVLVDVGAERSRLQQELHDTSNAMARLDERLASPEFTGKAPAAVIDKERQRMEAAKEKIAALKKRLAELE